MGIVETELAAYELSTGQRHVVEYNAGETIHLHIDNIRLDFTPAEFDHFVEILLVAERRLTAVKEGSA